MADLTYEMSLDETRRIVDFALAVARGRQTVKAGWAALFRDRKRAAKAAKDKTGAVKS